MSVSTMLPCTLAITIEDEVLAKAFWITVIIMMPGAMKVVKGTPITSPRRGPMAMEKITMKSPAVTSGARRVCVQTFTKRSTSRSQSVQRPSQFTRPKRRDPCSYCECRSCVFRSSFLPVGLPRLVSGRAMIRIGDHADLSGGRPAPAAFSVRKGTPMSWTDERVEMLKKMWSEGQSASQIAKELGGVTRNAVIGKVHRLGLSNRTGGEPGAPVEPQPEPEPRVEAKPKAPPQPAPEAPAAEPEADDEDEVQAEPRVVPGPPQPRSSPPASRCRRSRRPTRSAPRPSPRSARSRRRPRS